MPTSRPGEQGGPLRVVIAEARARVRATIREALTGAGWAVAGEPVTMAQALRMVAEAATAGRLPDLAVIAVDLPGGGVRAAAELSAEHPDLPLVMITSRYHDDELLACLRAGAIGYLTTDTDPADLPETLAAAVAGRPALTPGMVARALAELRVRVRPQPPGADRRVDRLTAREWQVMGLVRQGLGTAAVARQLVLSPATVRVHVSSAVRKLRVGDRQEAVELLDRHGWP